MAEAEAAAIAATGASDNCGDPVALSAATTGDCDATITVTGEDSCGNVSSIDYQTRIDAEPPSLTRGTIEPCYDSVAEAEAAALAATGASDNCGDPVELSVATTGDCNATITVTGEAPSS